jgi:adenine C2-methylase RlmN of 23S rRNA A2503 and tRNA A37
MNTLSIFLISFLSFTLISYFILSRRTLKKILIAHHLLNNVNERLYHDHEILKTQFRQLAKINQVLFDHTDKLEVKTKNEKNKSK